MSRFNVPPLDPNFQKALESIIEAKKLDNDITWRDSILPLLLDRVTAISNSVSEYPAVSKSPLLQAINELKHALERILTHLVENFSTAAPFTIRRIAEILVQYDQSEYSLATVSLTHKYVLALARLVCVQSRETQFRNISLTEDSNSNSTMGVVNDGSLSFAEKEEYGLPLDIKYTRIMWPNASITETIMVKSKEDLMKKVAENETREDIGENGKDQQNMVPLEEGGIEEMSQGTSQETINASNKPATVLKLSETPVRTEEVGDDYKTSDSSTSVTKIEHNEPKGIKVQELIHPTEMELPETENDPLCKRARLD